MENKFTLKDLKTGMLVELRNGDKYLVLKDTEQGDFLISNSDWLSLNPYLDNFVDKDADNDFDIVKVYSLEYQCFAITENENWSRYKTILWQEEPEEMTLEEVCKELGRNIKIIK